MFEPDLQSGILIGAAVIEEYRWNWDAYVPLLGDIVDSFTHEITSYTTYDTFADNYYSNPLIDDLNARKVSFARLIDSL